MEVRNKFGLILTATITILGLGANIPQASVSAHHVRTYNARHHVRHRATRYARWVQKVHAKRHYTRKHVRRYAKKHYTKHFKAKKRQNARHRHRTMSIDQRGAEWRAQHERQYKKDIKYGYHGFKPTLYHLVKNKDGWCIPKATRGVFMLIFRRDLKKSPKYIQNEPLSVKTLKGITHAVRYGGHLIIPNYKADLAYHIISGDDYDNPYASIDSVKGDKEWGYIKDGYYLPMIPEEDAASEKSDYEQQNTSFRNQMVEDPARDETIKDLQEDRDSVGEAPFNTDNYNLNAEANRRAHELIQSFSHQNVNGEYASDEDGNVDAENIAYTSGEGPKESADTSNYSMFNQEKADDGIHYDNIVNHNNVGVGVARNGSAIYIAEDFN